MFKGLKVIELANVLAGPMVGTFFSELGAEVIKVENTRTNGDMTRGWKLPTENHNTTISAYYSSINYNKNVWMLDLTKLEDKQKIYDAVKSADIVISNFKSGSAEKLGMDHATLSNLNNRLIYAHITGFGENNSRPAYDLVLQAETGYMYMNGQSDSPPTKMPVALIDVLTAHQIKEGILTALYKREQTGKGAYITCSLYDTAIASLTNQASNWLMVNHIPERSGSLHPNIAPYGEVFTTKDQHQITLAIGTDKQFTSLCQILKINDASLLFMFNNNQKRVDNRGRLDQLLSTQFTLFNKTVLIKAFEKQQVPYGIIKNMKQVFESKDAKNLILNEEIDGVPTKRTKTAVFQLNQNN